VESPGKLPALVIESVREFAKPEYDVDLLKLESPLAANGLPRRDGSAAARAAQQEFDAVGEICRQHDIPWVLLSGGAAHDKFERVPYYAYATGAGGFLAGRTIWLDAVRTHFPDLAEVSAALKKESVSILNSVSSLTKAHSPSWEASFPKFDQVRQEGDFARTYSG
jgi:tagatose 1,6-diphosphate aldolase